GLGALPVRHPVADAPVVGEVGDEGGEAGDGAAAGGGRLHVEGVGVRLVPGAAAALDPVLVAGAGADAGHVPAPQPALVPLQRVCPGVPPVEGADDGDAVGVGGPDGEAGALGVGVGAEEGVAVGEAALLPAPDGFRGETGHRTIT